MGYLPQILLALGALAVVDAGFEPPVATLAGCLALAAVPFGLAAFTAALGKVGRFRAAQLGLVGLTLSAPLLHLAAVLLLGWPEVVEDWTGARPTLLGWAGPALLAGVAPYLVYELLAIEARVRWLDASGTRARSRAFALRLLLASALPLVALAALSFVLSYWYPARVWVEEVSFAAIGATVLVAAVFGSGLPFLLVTIWGGRPLEARGWQRALLAGLVAETGVGVRQILLWPTGGRIANAAVVGFAPWNRFLLFTDGLLARLSPRELAGVVGHELGHVRRHHVPAFAAWTGTLFLVADLAQVRWGTSHALAGAVLAAAALVWYVGFGYLSRRFELEADLESLALTGDPEALVGALEELRGAGRRRRSSWRHFDTERRVAFLRRAEADPAFAHRFQRRLALGRRAAAAALALALAVQGWTWLDRLPGERLWVDLRLAHYGRAAEWAADAEGADEDVLALVRHGAQVVPRGGERTRAAWGLHWELEARRELAAHELDAARRSLQLAVLVGRDDLAPVLRALDGAREASGSPAAHLPVGWGELWGPASG